MDIYVDSRPLPWAGDLPPVEAISRLLEELSRRQRVVESIVLDGRPLGNEWEEVYRCIGQGRAHSLRLRTIPVQRMLWNTLHVLAEELPALLDEIEEVVSLLRWGEDRESFIKLPAVLEKVESYTQFLSALMQYEPAQVVMAEKHISRLTHWLSAVVEAWRNEDFVLVADYLQYELVPLFQAGITWLQELSGRNRRAGGQPAESRIGREWPNGTHQEVQQ